MFKLPEADDYFQRVTPVAIPNKNGGYYQGNIVAKFRYMPQSWLDQHIKGAASKEVDEQEVDQYLAESSPEAQIDLLEEVLHGFEGVQIGDRELSDSVKADRDELIKDGRYSMYFRVALITSFFNSISGARGKLTKRGN